VKGWRASDLTGASRCSKRDCACLMGIILGTRTIVAMAANWNRGMGVCSVKNSSRCARALSLDLAAAEFIPLAEEQLHPFLRVRAFIIFVRTALSPNSQRGLEIVRIASRQARGVRFVRMATPF